MVVVVDICIECVAWLSMALIVIAGCGIVWM